MRRHTFSTLPLRIQAAILAQVACNRISFLGKEAQYSTFRTAVNRFRFDKTLLTAARRVLEEMASSRAATVNAAEDPYYLIMCAQAVDEERRTQNEMIMEQIRFYEGTAFNGPDNS